MQFRDLRAQYIANKEHIDSAILNVIESSVFIGGSPVSELEDRLAGFAGTKHCITCGNGTDALQLALMAWGVGSGDAVFVPDFTFFSSGEVVGNVGATPIFVDVDSRSFNLDPLKLEAAVRSVIEDGALRPRVVVAVDLFGLPAEYPAIRKVCDTYDMLLLEDGAQGFGGSINGRRACSFGDISTTSFFPAKPLGCYGDGGAVFTDNDEWAALVRSYAVHGKGSMKYDNVRLGMNSRLDTIQAAILMIKLSEFESHEVQDVNRVACWYDSELAESDLVLPQRYEGYLSSWAQYTIQLPVFCDRSLLQSLLKKQGIPTMVYYPKPMHEQMAFRELRDVPQDYSETSRLCSTVLSLPMGPYITFEEVCIVARAVVDGVRSFS